MTSSSDTMTTNKQPAEATCRSEVTRSHSHRCITVEPLLAAFMFCIFLLSTLEEQLIYRKTCFQLYNASICQGVIQRKQKQYNRFENPIQQESAKWLLYKSMLVTFPSVVSTLVLGSISDRVGRKFMMLLPFIGCSLQTAGLVINAYYVYFPVPFIFIGSVIAGIFGNYAFALTSMFSYIADITTTESRTLRVGLLELMICIGAGLGAGLSGLLIDKCGFFPVFASALGIYLLCICYIILFVKESHFPSNEKKLNTFVSLKKHIFHVLRVTCRKRSNGHRLHILMLLGVLIMNVLVFDGSAQIGILYVKHEPLKWSTTLTGYYLAGNFITKGAGLLIGIPLLSKVFNFEDYSLMVIAIVTTMVNFVISGFAVKTWILFFAMIVSTPGGLAIPCIRSRLTKMVNKDEQASLMAAVSSGDVLASILANVIFDNLYLVTVGWYPGFAFFVMAFLLFIPFFAIWYLQSRSHKVVEYAPINEETEDQVNPIRSSQYLSSANNEVIS